MSLRSLLGDYTDPDEKERGQLRMEIDLAPVAVFQELNKYLNERGLQLTVSAIIEEVDR